VDGNVRGELSAGLFAAGDGGLGAAHALGQLGLAEMLGLTQRSELLAKLEHPPGPLLSSPLTISGRAKSERRSFIRSSDYS
jgi:hypothetical protein